MTEPLSNCVVWATRPSAQNVSWLNALEQQGFNAVSIPLLSIDPVSESDAVQAVKNLIMDFDQFNKVIFVSQNAVTQTFKWLDDYWPQLPVGIEYFAVGEKTADCVKHHVENVKQGSLDVVCGSTTMNSEELLGLDQLQDVWGQRILICRGKGGLPKLGEALHARGAFVHYCELYLRQIPLDISRSVAHLLREHNPEQIIIPVFSGETLNNLNSVISEIDESLKSQLRLVVPGKRVQQTAEDMGYAHCTVATNASSTEMREAVIAAAHRGIN